MAGDQELYDGGHGSLGGGERRSDHINEEDVVDATGGLGGGVGPEDVPEPALSLVLLAAGFFPPGSHERPLASRGT